MNDRENAAQKTGRILVLAAGGTILKQQHGDHMEWSVNSQSLLEEACPGHEFSFRDVYRGLNASLKVSHIIKIARVIESAPESKVLILTGTDAMEELAYCLSRLLRPDGTVVVTGSMIPYGKPGFEGIKNVQNACALLSDNTVPDDLYVVMNDEVYYGDGLVKSHSTSTSAFAFHSLKAGEFLAGEPNITSARELRNGWLPALDTDRDVDSITIPIALTNVGMNSLNFGPVAPDGMVIAGMGAGSIPESVLSDIDELLATNVPVVLSTRCSAGPNHAENLYVGSIEKYTSRGILAREFVGLNSLQCRMELLLRIACNKLQ